MPPETKYSGPTDELVESLYSELRAIARREHYRAGSPQTLQPTALINEAYMKLRKRAGWESQSHFLGCAATAIRHILIDAARARMASKRDAPTYSYTQSLDSMAAGAFSAAYGFDTRASGLQSIAIGSESRASADRSIAIGANASSLAENSVAIGAGSIANIANTFSVGFVGGERRIVNVANGTVAAGSTDAVNGGQLFAVQSAAANAASAAAAAQTTANGAQATANTALANAATAQASANSALADAATAQGTANAALTSAAAAQTTANAAVAQNDVQDTQIAAIQVLNNTQNTRLTALETMSIGAIPALQSLTSLHSAQISKLFELSDRDRRDARRGTSAAVALVAAPMPSNVGGVSYTLNAATFRGEQAIGMSVAYRANMEDAFAVVAGVSYAGGKSTAARVGVAGEF